MPGMPKRNGGNGIRSRYALVSPDTIPDGIILAKLKLPSPGLREVVELTVIWIS